MVMSFLPFLCSQKSSDPSSSYGFNWGNSVGAFKEYHCFSPCLGDPQWICVGWVTQSTSLFLAQTLTSPIPQGSLQKLLKIVVEMAIVIDYCPVQGRAIMFPHTLFDYQKVYLPNSIVLSLCLYLWRLNYQEGKTKPTPFVPGNASWGQYSATLNGTVPGR